MTVATLDRVEVVYSLLKQHEKSLACVAWSGHRVESDIFCELLAETRAMALELEVVLEGLGSQTADISVPGIAGAVTPRVLSDQRRAFRDAYQKAVSQYPAKSSVRNVLETHLTRLSGAGQEKLEILCAAVIGGQ